MPVELLAVILIILGMWCIAILGPRHAYRTKRGIYKWPRGALRSLIDDIKSARTSLEGACLCCRVEDASPELIAELEQALRDAKARDVKLKVIIGTRPPSFLENLAKDGIIVLERRAVQFSYRIIDNGGIVERHVGIDPALYPAGPFIRTRHAHDIAGKLRDIAAAVPLIGVTAPVVPAEARA